MLSTLNQTYQNIEVICIDDGSTDNGISILKEFERDSRIKIISQENQGVSSARNKGIEISTGDYLLFLDADDELPENAVEEFLKYRNFDLVISGFCQIREQNTQIFSPKTKTIKKEEITMYISNNENTVFIVPILGKIFNGNIIRKNNLKFSNINYGEDTHFIYQYIKIIENIKVIENILYKNHIIEGTLSRKKIYDLENTWYSMEQVTRKGLEIDKENFKLKSYLYLRAIKTVLFLSMKNEISYRDFEKLISIIKKDIPSIKNIRDDKFLAGIYTNTLNFLIKLKSSYYLYIFLKIIFKIRTLRGN